MNFQAQARFFHQLASLLDAGIPLTRGLAMASPANSSRDRKIAQRAGNALNSGEDWATAIAPYARFWDGWTTELLHLAEQSGTLAAVCHHLARTKQNYARLQKRYRAIAMALGVLGWSLSLLGAALAHGDARVLLKGQAWCVALLWLVIVFGIANFLAHNRGVRLTAIATVPPLSNLFRAQALQQLADLALPLAGGLPLSAAMVALQKQSRDPRLAAALRQISPKLQRGIPLSQCLRSQIPADAWQLIQGGEESGELDPMLEQVGSYYLQLEERQLKHLKSLAISASLMSLGASIAWLGFWGLSSLFESVRF